MKYHALKWQNSGFVTHTNSKPLKSFFSLFVSKRSNLIVVQISKERMGGGGDGEAKVCASLKTT